MPCLISAPRLCLGRGRRDTIIIGDDLMRHTPFDIYGLLVTTAPISSLFFASPLIAAPEESKCHLIGAPLPGSLSAEATEGFEARTLRKAPSSPKLLISMIFGARVDAGASI